MRDTIRLLRQKVTREYKSLDTVQCNDIGKLFEASWGSGDNVVDVKQQVKKLQLFSNSFIADGKTLGDPWPGHVKKLRFVFLRKQLSRWEFYYDQEYVGCDDIGELFEASWGVGDLFGTGRSQRCLRASEPCKTIVSLFHTFIIS